MPLIHGFSEPIEVVRGSSIPSNRFQEAVDAFDSEDFVIPPISEALIQKYVTDLQFLGFLEEQHLKENHMSSADILEPPQLQT